MVSGNSAHVITRQTAAMLTDGCADYFERTLLTLVGNGVNLGMFADVLDAVAPPRSDWNFEDWSAQHAAVREQVNTLLVDYDIADFDMDSQQSRPVDSVFVDIITDTFVTYWNWLSSAVVRNTLVGAGADANRYGANRFKPFQDYISCDHYLELRILDTESDNCDFSETDCESRGCWYVVNPTRLTPAAKALERFITEEWWGTGVDD